MFHEPGKLNGLELFMDDSAEPQACPEPRRRPPHRRRRRRRRLRPIHAVVGVLLVVALACIGEPVVRAWLPEATTPTLPLRESLGQALRLRTMQVFAIVWIFFFGASIGSFLNVVVYRAPRGKTLLGPSRCPRCQQTIRPRHNVPVFGWIALGGRCRDCRLPIAPRYPIVELIVGLVFLTLAAGELFTGGATLPIRKPNYYTGIAMVVFDPQWDLIAIYLTHALLVSVLISWGLIQYDGERIPRAYLGLVPLAALAFSTLLPHINPIPWNAGVEHQFPACEDPRLNALISSLAGAGIGGLVGWLLAGIAQTAHQPDRWGRALEHSFGFVAAGTLLGWQSIATIAIFSSVLQVIYAALAHTESARRAALLPMAAAVWAAILLWRATTEWSVWPSAGDTPVMHLAGWLLAGLGAVVIRGLAGQMPSVDAAERAAD